MRNIMERKDRYAEEVQDQTKLFETLKERKESGFEVISEFLGKGLFVNRWFKIQYVLKVCKWHIHGSFAHGVKVAML